MGSKWQKPEYEILIDTREQRPLKFKRNVKIMKLDYGDYAFSSSEASCKAFVERKAVGDFLGTISGGYERFLREIQRSVDDDANLIIFDENYKNEVMPGIFRSETALQKGIVKKMNQFNVTQAIINVEENDIIIFPSKTIHSTQASKSNDERISISADIIFVAKDSKLLEMGLPPLNEWTKI